MATSRISTEMVVTPQSAVLRAIWSRSRSSIEERSDSSAVSIEDPISSRSEVWATRSIAWA